MFKLAGQLVIPFTAFEAIYQEEIEQDNNFCAQFCVCVMIIVVI